MNYYCLGTRLGLRTKSLLVFLLRDLKGIHENTETTDPDVGEFVKEQSAAVVQESRLRVEQRSMQPTDKNEEEDIDKEIKEYERLLFGLLEFLSGPQTLSYSGSEE